jgi:hypothetical protein
MMVAPAGATGGQVAPLKAELLLNKANLPAEAARPKALQLAFGVGNGLPVAPTAEAEIKKYVPGSITVSVAVIVQTAKFAVEFPERY